MRKAADTGDTVKQSWIRVQLDISGLLVHNCLSVEAARKFLARISTYSSMAYSVFVTSEAHMIPRVFLREKQTDQVLWNSLGISTKEAGAGGGLRIQSWPGIHRESLFQNKTAAKKEQEDIWHTHKKIPFQNKKKPQVSSPLVQSFGSEGSLVSFSALPAWI